MNDTLKKRLLSFAWRLGAYVVVAGIGFTVSALSDFGVRPEVIAVIALIAGEVTKYLNKKYQLGSKVLGKSS